MRYTQPRNPIPTYRVTLRRLAESSQRGSNQGLAYSLILHCLMAVLALYGLPHWWKKPMEEYVVSVELVPITKKTNLQPKFTAEKPKEAEAKPAAADQKTQQTAKEKPAPHLHPQNQKNPRK